MKRNIIWDLSGTLFRPQYEGMSDEEKQDYSFLFLMWSGKKNPSYYDILTYQILCSIGEQSETDPSNIIRDPNGKPVPEIVCAFLAGRINSEEALQRVLKFLDTAGVSLLEQDDYPIIRRMLITYFNPLSLAHCIRPIACAEKLLYKTANHTDQLFILSNWDKDSFVHVYNAYKKTVFSVFKKENIVISADTGYVKPQKGIYNWLLSHCQLQPKNCFFIDDQQENIRAGTELGIAGIRFQEQKIEAIEKALKEQHII